MRKLFCLFSLLVLSATSYAVQGWMWFNQFPWVYSHEDENWIYVATEIEVSLYDGGKWSKQDDSYHSNLGWVWMNRFPWGYSINENKWIYIYSANLDKIYAYGSWNNEWSALASYKHDWDKQYAKWILDPEPYGGLSTLEKIKEAKDTGHASLSLTYNISDLTPLAGLTNLLVLELDDNNISDLSPLAGLTNLEWLTLINNNISDLSPLAGLTNLEWLFLEDNNISDLTPLAGLTNLGSLSLYDNNISDLTPLAGLTNLFDLYLDDNNISDLSPLANMHPWTDLEGRVIQAQFLGATDSTVKLLWNGQNFELSLANLSQESKNLAQRLLDENHQNGLTNLTELSLQGNPITISQKAMLEEALPITSIGWPNEIINDSQESEKTWEQKYEEWILDPEPYGGLATLEKIKEAKDNMSTTLDLSGEYGNSTNITDLTPLAGLTNLTKLILFNNYEIQNVEPLETLVNLIELNLTGNKIDDISSIGNLTKLENLQLQDNRISNEDISIFAMLPNLKILNLEENEITDYSPLATLTDLTDLRLGQMTMSASQKAMLEEALPNTNITWPNEIIEDRPWYLDYEEWIQNPEPYGGLATLEKIKEAKESGFTELELGTVPPEYETIYISDVTPLSELTNLKKLSLFNTYNVQNIEPLSTLVNLTNLDLTSNTISDITPIEKLKNLEFLYLQDCGLKDDHLASLSKLPKLTVLNLRENEILDPSPLAEFPSLKTLAFGGSGGDNDQAALPGLAKLSNLEELDLIYFSWGDSADSQKLALEQALPNTTINIW